MTRIERSGSGAPEDNMGRTATWIQVYRPAHEPGPPGEPRQHRPDPLMADLPMVRRRDDDVRNGRLWRRVRNGRLWGWLR